MNTQAFARGYDDFNCDCVLAAKPETVTDQAWREYLRGVDAAQSDDAINSYDGY